ncbi:MAG: response regulator [Candidatus Obscuribacterales bacterium]|nr:response regulator [Steroidobacteraceae bacterium]
MSESKTELRVLLVEDSKLVADQIQELLQSVACNVAVTVVATESEALRAAVDLSPDIVILDLQLKQGTGFGVLKGLTSIEPEPTIAVLTNHALPKYRDLALMIGADYFLDKAHDFEALAGIIELIGRAREPSPTRMH